MALDRFTDRAPRLAGTTKPDAVLDKNAELLTMTTLYGLNNCDTCKKARKWLDRFGVAHTFIDYRDSRQAPETLAAWKERLGGWDAMINKSSTTWRTLPDNRKSPGSDAEWKLLLKEYPQLIRRPVVVTGDGQVTQGFSDNGFKQRFGVGK